MCNSIPAFPFQVVKECTVKKKHPGILTCMTMITVIIFIMFMMYILQGIDWLCGVKGKQFGGLKI